MPLLTFVIPVRHQDNARDWAQLKQRLAQTLRSVSAQTHDDWRGIVVANSGADLPEMPERFSVARVDFPPNPLHEQGGASQDAFREAVRWDKGRRILTGILATRDSRYFMTVDDDDFIPRELVAHVAAHPDAFGWRVDRGYVWNSDGRMMIEDRDFSQFCGTSLIVRGDLYALPATLDEASDELVKDMLGSHVRINGILENRGTPLSPLPFVGSIYRVAHGGSHSVSQNFWRRYLLNAKMAKRPAEFLRRLSRVRTLSATIRRDFFGQG